MDYYRLREKRVLALIHKQHGKGRGAFVAFAGEFGIAPSQVSRWFMPGENRRNIGEDMARRIEDKYNLDRGYLVMPEETHTSSVVSMQQPWPFLPTVTREQYDHLPQPTKDKILGYLEGKVSEAEIPANTGRKKSVG
jgi:hypothetical protein